MLDRRAAYQSSGGRMGSQMNSLPGISDEIYLNNWIKGSDNRQIEFSEIGPLVKGSESFSNQVCLEDHRLLIDQAIDKLKGELQQKEKDVIIPIAYRQKQIIEEYKVGKEKLEKRLSDLE